MLLVISCSQRKTCQCCCEGREDLFGSREMEQIYTESENCIFELNPNEGQVSYNQRVGSSVDVLSCRKVQKNKF